MLENEMEITKEDAHPDSCICVNCLIEAEDKAGGILAISPELYKKMSAPVGETRAFKFFPDFTTEEEADELLKLALTLPYEEVGSSRKACFVGEPDVVPYYYSEQEHKHNPIPDWLQPMFDRVNEAVFSYARGEFFEEFNGCLINLFEKETNKMGWHSDVEDTLVVGSPVAVYAVGSLRDLRFRNPEKTREFGMPMYHGAMLVMNERMRRDWKHSIAGVAHEVSEPRVSFSFRVLRRK